MPASITKVLKDSRYYRRLGAAVFLTAASLSSPAAVLCNKTAQGIDVTTMLFDAAANEWIKEGWFHSNAGECISIGQGATSGKMLYYFAKSGSGVWSGDGTQSQCVPKFRFIRKADDACDAQDQHVDYKGIASDANVDLVPTPGVDSPSAGSADAATGARDQKLNKLIRCYILSSYVDQGQSGARTPRLREYVFSRASELGIAPNVIVGMTGRQRDSTIYDADTESGRELVEQDYKFCQDVWGSN